MGSEMCIRDRYETVMETVVVQEASTELVYVPATFATYTETVATQEASTQMVLVPIAEPAPAGDVIVTTGTRQASSETKNAKAQVRGAQGLISVNSAISDSSRARPAQPLASNTEPFRGRINTDNIRGQFTVFDGVNSEVVESTETKGDQIGEILARVEIPAKYKTITRRVIKTPASTQERVIPAVSYTHLTLPTICSV